MFVILFLMVLMSIAFLTLMERKVFSYIQIRKGPNKVFGKGVFQPFADGEKLFIKEKSINYNSNKLLFLLFPMMSFFMMLMFWALFNFNFNEILMYSVILFMLLSGVGIYSVLGSGWSSNSKYAMLGAYRSVAQTISYEVGMLFLLFFIIFMNNSYNLFMIQNYKNLSLNLFFGFFFIFVIWMVVILAELNRSPFDFAESESELVSGFNIEYGAGKFALIFLAEYGNIIFMSFFSSFIFFINLKMILPLTLIFVIIWVRGTFPRFRYDNLMYMSWKMILPLTLISLMNIFILKMLF